MNAVLCNEIPKEETTADPAKMERQLRALMEEHQALLAMCFEKNLFTINEFAEECNRRR